MLDWPAVATARVGDSTFVLARHGADYLVRVDQRILMTSQMSASEVSLAEHSLEACADPRTILVGGLGMGYTLRAVLDLVDRDAQVTVGELVPELVEWNRTQLGQFNDHPLTDPRTTVVVGDVYDLIKKSQAAYDVIMLDVDNGPQALAQAKNQRLYSDGGVRACRDALRPGGVLGVWSNGPNAKYVQRLERAGFDVAVRFVESFRGSRARHVLFLGR
jgi:spermidine synthase